MPRNLQSVLQQSMLFHEAVHPLWDVEPLSNRRSLASTGFCLIVRQHATSQMILATQELDVTAATLVRPTFEALLRAGWCKDGADDDWLESFLSPTPDALTSDAETRMGLSVDRMMLAIQDRHPAWLLETLNGLKARSWRAMHSYVHGGIRPFVQALSPMPEHELAGVVINANGMLLLATQIARLSAGVASPMLPTLQKEHRGCLP